MFARHMATHTRDWLRIAHDTFLWRHLPAWNRSLAKQVVKHPKGLLQDSGLLHRLLRIATPCWEFMGRHGHRVALRGFENHGLQVIENRRLQAFSQVLDLFDAQVRIRQDGFRIASHCTPLHPGVNLPLNESELEDLGR